MKKLLYLLTILFNAIGIFCSMSLFFIFGSKGIEYLPIIIAGCIVFAISFTITTLDFNNSKKNRRNYRIVYQNKNAIEDYGDYFRAKKYDFTV